MERVNAMVVFRRHWGLPSFRWKRLARLFMIWINFRRCGWRIWRWNVEMERLAFSQENAEIASQDNAVIESDDESEEVSKMEIFLKVNIFNFWDRDFLKINYYKKVNYE